MTGLERAFRAGVAAWVRFWFHAPDTRALELVRIGVGLTLLLSYLGQVRELGAFYTDAGWMPLAQTPVLDEEPTSLSLLFLDSSPTAVWCLYVVTIATALAFTAGWRTNAVKWALLLAHYSFTRRAPPIGYGVDFLCSNLLVIQCFLPLGRALALDALGRRPPALSRWGVVVRSVGLRLIQVQMVIIMSFAGLEKLRGDDWWDGMGIWFAMTDWEFAFGPLAWFASHPWLINGLSYASVAFELSYGFLIWGRRTGPATLMFAAALHVGVAVTMGLWLFSIAMLFGHLAFAPPRWLTWLRATDPDQCSAPLPPRYNTVSAA